MNEIRYLLTFLAPFKWRVALAALLGFLAVAANVGMMGTSGYLIAAAALHPPTILMLWVPIVGVRFFGLSRAVFRYLERLMSHDLTFRVLALLRVWLYRRIEPNNLLLQAHRSSEILDAAVVDVDLLQNLYLRAVAPPVIGFLTAGLICAVLASRSGTIAIALAGGMAMAGIGIPWLTHRLGSHTGAQLHKAKSDLTVQTSELITGMTEWLAYGQVQAALARVETAHKRVCTLQARQGWLQGASDGAFLFVTQATVWMVLCLAIPEVVNRQLPGVLLPALLLAVLASFEALAPLPAAFQQLGQMLAAARRLLAVAGVERDAPVTGLDACATAGDWTPSGTPAGDKIPGWTNTGDKIPGRTTACDWTPGATADDGTPRAAPRATPLTLAVRGLCVSYGPYEPLALSGIDFDLPLGKHLAIVGESGAGKTTLLRALLHLVPYCGGSIRLGNLELCQWPEEELRRLVTVVPQRAYLFHTSIANNLRLAKPGATLPELERAGRMAQIHDVIARLPDGYDTLAGEQGTRLSGGERQRLALARALLKDAPIVLLDEPTTGLDSATEAQWLEALRTVTSGRSVIWITHRLVGLQEMDEILVLHSGRVIERGTHRELLAQHGQYWQMWTLQQEFVQ